MIKKAENTLYGLIAGDSLGGLVEFNTVEKIKELYPNGKLNLIDGGNWGLLAGQPTDDGELSLALANSLINGYNIEDINKSYKRWIESNPFDCGLTIGDSLRGYNIGAESQSNGSLMRIAPLAIWGNKLTEDELWDCVIEESRLTHYNLIVNQTSAIYACLIRYHLLNEHNNYYPSYQYLLQDIIKRKGNIDRKIIDVVMLAISGKGRKPDYLDKSGWCLVAFQNALYHLYNTETIEDALNETIMSGGDTDTNAAICGALMGSFGHQIPEKWINIIDNCNPNKDNPSCKHPRPEEYHPNKIKELVAKMLL